MRELRDRLRVLDGADAPDLWPDAQRRMPRAEPEQPAPRRPAASRVIAGVVAFAVFIAAAVLVWQAFRPGPTGVQAPGDTVAGTALWPERTAADLGHTQALADAGDPSVAWRLDPTDVATRFAEEVLGWGRPGEGNYTVSIDPSSGLASGVTATVSHLAIPCPTPPPGEAGSCPPPYDAETVTLRQLGTKDDGGVWSVTSVVASSLSLHLDPGQQIANGTEVDGAISFPSTWGVVPGFHAQVGYHAGADASCDVSQANEAQPGDGTLIALTVDPSACASTNPPGYAWIETGTEVVMPQGSVKDPLHFTGNDISPRFYGLTLVPITLSFEASATLSSTASAAVTEGEHVIGYHGVLVSVPSSWAINATTCGTPVRDTVIRDQGGVLGCLIPRPPGISSIEFVDDPSQWLSKLRVAAATTNGNGVSLRFGTIEGRNGEAVSVPDAGVLLMMVVHPADERERIIDSIRLADTDPNGCAMHVTDLMPPGIADQTPETGLVDEVLPGSPTAVTICHYVDDWLASSATLTGEQMTQLADVINALPQGFAHAPKGTYLPSTCEEPSSAGGERGSGYLLRVEGDGTPATLWAHVGICGPLGITNGVRAGQLTPEFAKLLNAPLHHGYEMPGQLVTGGG